MQRSGRRGRATGKELRVLEGRVARRRRGIGLLPGGRRSPPDLAGWKGSHHRRARVRAGRRGERPGPREARCEPAPGEARAALRRVGAGPPEPLRGLLRGEACIAGAVAERGEEILGSSTTHRRSGRRWSNLVACANTWPTQRSSMPAHYDHDTGSRAPRSLLSRSSRGSRRARRPRSPPHRARRLRRRSRA